MQTTVLVVEDEPAIRQGIVDALEVSGYGVVEAGNGEDGAREAASPGIDLMLLDLMLPRLPGLEVLRRTRAARPGLPVIILTARGAEDDRVEGLRAGADDYVVKPFSARELLARIEAVLRRSAERPTASVGALTAGDRVIDLARREVRRDGERVELTERESQIVAYLAAHPDRAISRQELLERVWGIDGRGVATRTVDMHVVRLRDKLGDADPFQVIVTVRGKGYMIGQDVEAGA